LPTAGSTVGPEAANKGRCGRQQWGGCDHYGTVADDLMSRVVNWCATACVSILLHSGVTARPTPVVDPD
jgi:hypothetical protein